MNSKIKRYGGQGLGGSQGQELLFLWSCLCHYQGCYGFPELETLRNPRYWNFYGDFII